MHVATRAPTSPTHQTTHSNNHVARPSRRRAPPALHAWFSDSGGAVHRAEGKARADGRRLDGEAGAHTSTAHAANSNHMHTTTPILDHTCRRLRPPHDIMPRPTAKASCEGTPSCPTPTAGGCGWRGGLRRRLSRQVLAGLEVCTLRTRCVYTTRASHSLCVRTHVRRLTALSVMPLPTSRRMSCSTHASSAASLPVASPNPIPNPNPNPRRKPGPQPWPKPGPEPGGPVPKREPMPNPDPDPDPNPNQVLRVRWVTWTPMTSWSGCTRRSTRAQATWRLRYATEAPPSPNPTVTLTLTLTPMTLTLTLNRNPNPSPSPGHNPNPNQNQIPNPHTN